MTIRRAAALACASLLLLALSCSAIDSRRPTLPDRLDDATFWRLFTELSEPGGTFRSENLVSNERAFPAVLPEVARRASPTAAYIGVGPEQNFSYLAALRPRVAFIVDIRRGNAALHLLYKAIFELSPTRAEFLSRLFSRPLSKHLGPAVQRERTDGRRRDRNRRVATCSRPTSRRCARSSPRGMAGRSATRTSSA